MSLEPSNPSDNIGSFWTSERLELKSWFSRNAQILGGLYEASLIMIHDKSFPGRIQLISHAIREIRNSLPDKVGGYVKRKKVDYIGKLDVISKLWIEFKIESYKIINDYQPVPDSQPIQGMILPLALFSKIKELISDHNRSHETRKEQAFRLFDSLIPENKDVRESLTPIVNQWLEVTEWFVSICHVGDKNKVNVVEEDQLLSKFDLFERMLLSLIRGFFKTLKELDEILEKANA